MLVLWLVKERKKEREHLMSWRARSGVAFGLKVTVATVIEVRSVM